MERFLLVCVGGALGSGARYLVSLWMFDRLGPGFPWGTLTVNVLGSFTLGALMVVASTAAALPASVWIGLSAGVLGGFTTYSTFAFEAFRYADDGSWPKAALYVAVTMAGGLGACALGALAGRAITAH